MDLWPLIMLIFEGIWYAVLLSTAIAVLAAAIKYLRKKD
jgi:hypothetical protein